MMNQPSPLNLSSFIHFLNCSSPYFEGADGADGVVVERWWGHKIKARFLSEPSLLLQTSRCLYCSFTMFPLCIYSFPARLLKHPHTTAFQAPRLLGEAPALAPFLSRPPASTPHPALRFPQPPPRIRLPARPPCPSRLVPSAASQCNALSLQRGAASLRRPADATRGNALVDCQAAE